MLVPSSGLDRKASFYFLTSIFIAFGLVVAAIFIFISITKMKDRVVSIDIENLLYIKNLSMVTEQELTLNRAFALTGGIQFLELALERRKMFLILAQKLRERIQNERAQQLLVAILDAKELHIQAVEKWFDLHRAGASLKANSLFFESMVIPKKELLQTAIDNTIFYFDEQVKIAWAHSEQMAKLAIGLFLLASAIGILSGFWLFSRLVKVLQQKTKIERALFESQSELLRSNKDLEQFAYVASHDLQEPIRMVGSFTELLARRYRGKLDKDADEFIEFISNGARRMQSLIQDLLAYSRIGSKGVDLALVDSESVFKNTLKFLTTPIEESGAQITFDKLPTVKADSVQLGQVFQNLLSNAIKFSPGQIPKIYVSAKKSNHYWTFSVQDNGIGVAPEYFERVFIMFQRLHGANEYPGTGIGLAICKRIIDRHGGKIWIESKSGMGSTLYFSLPSTELSN